jgi:hypothetical protein
VCKDECDGDDGMVAPLSVSRSTFEGARAPNVLWTLSE